MNSSLEFPDLAADEFFRFVAESVEPEKLAGANSLSDLIDIWFDEDGYGYNNGAVSGCDDNVMIYLQAVPLIINEWLEHRDDENPVIPKRITRIFCLGFCGYHCQSKRILNPDHFQMMKCARDQARYTRLIDTITGRNRD